MRPAAIAMALTGAVAVAAGLAIGTNPTCAFADGSSASGACMFSDEFNGAALDPAVWLAEDEWLGPLLDGAPTGCVTSSNVSVSGGTLKMTMTNHSRSSCPQTWTANAYYAAHFAAGWPTGQPTLFDTSVVDAKTFKFKYGRIAIRMKMPGGTGPTADVSLWGENCQSGGAGHQLLLGLFNNVGSCMWPQPGSREFDIPNFTHSNLDGKQIIFALHTDNVSAAPSLRNFNKGDVSIPYYGAEWAPAASGDTPFLSSVDYGDPTAAFHVYETDWRPGQWSVFIDGQLFGTNTGAWVPTDNMFPMFWNVDQTTTSSVGLPTTMEIDYVRVWCPPGVPCVWSGA